jgi:DNA-binding GntR family transcriptional regulator
MPRSSGQWRREPAALTGEGDGMSPGPTFDRVYLALKEQLMSGSFAPGEHLEPAAIGEDLNSSITPVRDALHRLVGERIVEAPRNDGFRVPVPTEAELRDLYAWNRDLLELALRRHAPAGAGAMLYARQGEVQLDHPVFQIVADLFARIARRSGNPEHEIAIENLNDRLSAIRIVETRLFADLDEELNGLCAHFADGDATGLKRAIAVYHRRRQRAAPDLLVASRLPRDRG